jgi:serine/threonine protein phosphatase 1
MGRKFVFGDVHGQHDFLTTLLNYINPTRDDTLIFLGDLIDRGPESGKVVQTCLDYSHVVHALHLVRGNHEEMLQYALEGHHDFRYWCHFGGLNTLASYEVDHPRSIPYNHRQFLVKDSLPYYEDDDCIYAHANYHPHIPPANWPEVTLRWKRFELAQLQQISNHKKLIILGHTPQPNPIHHGPVVLLDTGSGLGGPLTALELNTGFYIQAGPDGLSRTSSFPESHPPRTLDPWNR